MTTRSHTPGLERRRERHDTAVTATATGLMQVERGQLRLPRCISEIAVAIDVVDRLLPSGLVVVLTSSQELVDHVADRWNRTHPDAAYLLTGTNHRSDVLARDVLVATTSAAIAAWACADTTPLRVIVGQHRHANLVGEGLLKAAGWADLLVVHDAHHTAGYAKRRAAVHDDTVLPAAARLYTTATPRILKRADTPTPADPDEIALSMDEEPVFGPVLHEYTAEQAITDRIAPRFRLHIHPLAHPSPDHNPPSTPPSTSDPATSDTSTTTATTTATEVGTPHLFCTHHNSRRTITVSLAETLTPSDLPQRDQDVPYCTHSTAADAADVAITVTHPEQSTTTTADVDTATITVTVTPAPGPTDDGWAETLQAHIGLRHTLRALRDWDPAFGRALDTARAHGPNHHHALLHWITIEPPPTGPSEPNEPGGLDGLGDALLAALVHIGAHHWWLGYGHLVAHHARTGNAVVPIRHTVDGYPLGQWQNSTRSLHLRQGLPLDRHNALQALGTTTDTQHDVNRQRRWEQHIATAQAFHTRYGHLDIDLPGTQAPRPFRAWLSLVRRGHWPVTDTERAALDALGMLWDPPLLLRRKAVAAAFVDHHARHGTLDIPDDLIVDLRGERTRLLTWVSVFRDEHRLGTLHPDVRQALQDVGFVFDPDTAWWQDLITTARQYHQLRGDLNVAPGTVHTAAGECLLTVLQTARTRSRRPSFDPDHSAALNALDPLWGTVRTPPATPPEHDPTPIPPTPPAPSPPTDPHADRHEDRRPVPQPPPPPSANAAWRVGLQAAWRHRDRFGHLLPATDYRDPLTGLLVMQWLSAQRRARRNGTLTPEQVAALDALDMIWDPAATSRRIGIQNARAYHAHHGHLRVSTTAPHYGTDARGEPFNLYNALARVRRDHANDTLHPEWREALDALGYDYAAEWSPLPDYVAALERYHAEHGNLDIAPHDPEYTSLKRVNAARWRSTLSPDLRQRLDHIGYTQDDRLTDWDDVFATVQRFYNEHGHIDVPPDLRAERPGGGQGPLVRPWLNNQRRRLQVGTTTQQQKEALDAVGFIWDAEEAEWMEKYRLACRFRQEHGHLAVIKEHVRDNPEWAPLPGWLRTQTRLRAAQHLSDKRVTLLDLIGMPWVERPGHEHRWEQRAQQVDTFRRTHGHTHIYAHLNQTTNTSEREELTKLAAWLNDQLVYAKRGTLRPDRREKLTAIGITVPTPSPGTAQDRRTSARAHRAEGSAG